jgi:hypothetical protein
MCLSKGKVGETAAADHRNLNTSAIIADITAEVENDRQQTVKNSLRPKIWWPKWFTPLSQGPAALKDVGQVNDPTALLGAEEGAIPDVRSSRSNGCCSS